MTFGDLLRMSGGNLWRMKLRSFLTISGVLIAIAAFVAMLSFGAGMQEVVSDEFDQLGLFNTMVVYPLENDTLTDSMEIPALDSTALIVLSAVPGVNLAYPFDKYTVEVIFRDTELTTSAQALPVSALHTKLYSQLAAGVIFESDTSRKIIISTRLLKELGIDSAESIIGDTMIVSVRVVSLDSALSYLLYRGSFDSLKEKARGITIDSLRSKEYRTRLINREFGDALGRFVDGFLNARTLVSDTLVISGVIERGRRRTGRQNMITSIHTGQKLSSAGFSGGQMELISALASGRMFSQTQGISLKTYSKITLDIDPHISYATIKDSVEALGFETFSFAEEFEEIQRIFLYFDLALGMVGLIALLTASLGIVNTMVMSITERRREIGVIKSLGADERDIRKMFLFESGLIGFIGAAGGILFGWVISRVASIVAKSFMVKEGAPEIELFAIPLWLILAGLFVGTLVALAAGYFPSARAARVDPVVALRSE